MVTATLQLLGYNLSFPFAYWSIAFDWQSLPKVTSLGNMTILVLLLLAVLTSCCCTLELCVEHLQEIAMLNTVFMLINWCFLLMHGKRTSGTNVSGLFRCSELDSKDKNNHDFCLHWVSADEQYFVSIGNLENSCLQSKHHFCFLFLLFISGRWKDNSGFSLSSESIALDRYVRRGHQSQVEATEKWCASKEQQFCEWNNFSNESYIMKCARTGYSSWSIFCIERTIIFLSCSFYTLWYLCSFM